MQCTCGGEAVYKEHEVKTEEKAKEWDKDYSGKLPAKVCRNVCLACGRQRLHGLYPMWS